MREGVPKRRVVSKPGDNEIEYRPPTMEVAILNKWHAASFAMEKRIDALMNDNQGGVGDRTFDALEYLEKMMADLTLDIGRARSAVAITSARFRNIPHHHKPESQEVTISQERANKTIELESLTEIFTQLERLKRILVERIYKLLESEAEHKASDVYEKLHSKQIRIDKIKRLIKRPRLLAEKEELQREIEDLEGQREEILKKGLEMYLIRRGTNKILRGETLS